MKKGIIKNLLLVVIMAVLCFAIGMTACAQDREIVDSGECGAEGDNVIWTLYDDGELVISGEGDMCDYSLGSSPFRSNTDIKNITIENGVTSIGNGAFALNFSRSVDIPDSVTTIGDYAFYFALHLENVTVPDNITDIGEGAFVCCINLLNINIPDSVTKIKNSTFLGCGSLTNIDIPDVVEIIEEYAFADCFGITDVIIPDSVKTIGKYAFGEMFFLDKIYVKSMDVALGEYFSASVENAIITGITYNEFLPLWKEHMIYDIYSEEYLKHVFPVNEKPWFGTIYCHSGSTAEAYAIKNGVGYVLTHFFEDEWIYDYDNLVRARKCIHCNELETEAIEPIDPETPDVPDEPVKETFIQKIINWFRDLFDKLFGWLKR